MPLFASAIFSEAIIGWRRRNALKWVLAAIQGWNDVPMFIVILFLFCVALSFEFFEKERLIRTSERLVL